MIRIAFLLLVALAVEWSAMAQGATDHAKKLFEKYVALESAFDPALADLYSDQALIENTRRFPDGSKRKGSLPASTYKRIIRQVLPTVAKAAGDKNRYSEIKYSEQDGKVRVTAVRYSELKKFSGPLSLLIGPENGRWLILEESSESLAQAPEGAEPFLKQTKSVPARREWNREIVSQNGGKVRFRVVCPERFGVTLITAKAFRDMSSGVKRKLTREELLLSVDVQEPSFDRTVALGKGSYYFILENQSDKTVEMGLECTEVSSAADVIKKP